MWVACGRSFAEQAGWGFKSRGLREGSEEGWEGGVSRGGGPAVGTSL